MKKFISMLLVLCILCPTALACENTDIVKIENGSMVLNGCAYFALSEDAHILAKTSPNEHVDIFAQTLTESTFIRGIINGGIIRTKGELKYLIIGEALYGLTKVPCTISIDGQHKETVKEIVERRIGEGTEITVNSIIACTTWRTESTIFHMAIRESVPHVVIGSFTVHKSTADICVSDFDGDGNLECCFLFAKYVPEKKEEELKPTVVVEQHVHVINKTVTNSCTKTTIIQDNRQININSNVVNVPKQIVKINTPSEKNKMTCIN